MRQLTDADIRAVTDRTNATPRKCLGWRTPAEIFAENMMKIGARSPLPSQPAKVAVQVALTPTQFSRRSSSCP
jgi:IS30 family transposase